MKDIKVESDVLFYHKKSKHKWTGPFKVLDSDGKVLHINFDGSLMQVYVDQIELYSTAERKKLGNSSASLTAWYYMCRRTTWST